MPASPEKSRRDDARRTRRRRRAEVAEADLLRAAETFLRRRPFRELTPEEIVKRAGMSRPSFYRYFRDRHDLVKRLLDTLGAELFAVADRWLAGVDDPRADLHAAFQGIVAVYDRNGPILRAIADAAGEDREVERAYRGLVARFVDVTAQRIASEIRRGRVAPLDSKQTAEALVWMNERYLIERLGRRPQADPAAVVDTLLTIWMRALYGRKR